MESDRGVITQEEFIGKEIARIRQICGPKGRVIGAVSGGVDSTVIERAQRFGVNVRIWVNEAEVRDGEVQVGGMRTRRKNSKWKRICR